MGSVNNKRPASDFFELDESALRRIRWILTGFIFLSLGTYAIFPGLRDDIREAASFEFCMFLLVTIVIMIPTRPSGRPPKLEE